jgi:hypothetical protein
MFWIVKKSDAAILGFVSGTRTQDTVDGPFESYDAAMEEKQSYRRFGCTWYTVVESKDKPESYTNEYEFVDAHREFEDCY